MAQYAQIVLDFGNTFAGDEFRMNWGGGSFNFTIAATVAAPNDVLEDNTVPDNAAANFVTTLNALPEASDYTISRTNNSVTITANVYGDQYNFGTFSWVVNSNGSTITVSSQRDNVGREFTATLESTSNVNCNGGSDGSATIAVIGVGAVATPFTVSWSDGANSGLTRTGMSAGTYTATVTSADSTQKVVSNITITEPTALSVTLVSKNDVLCHGASNGAININVSGGTAPYSYLWSNGETTRDITNATGGNNTVTVTDANGCTAELTVSLTQPTAIEVDVVQTGTDLDVTVSGGTPPYTFFWSRGDTTEDLTNVADGTYTLTVTDASGCSTDFSITVFQRKIFFSKNPITLALKANNPETKPNLSFVCEVWVEEEYLASDVVYLTNYSFVRFISNSTLEFVVQDGESIGNFASVKAGDKIVVRDTVSNNKTFTVATKIGDRITVLEDTVVSETSYSARIYNDSLTVADKFTKVAELEQPADENGETVFDVQAIIDAYVEADLPQVGQTFMSLATKAFTRFRLRHAEKFGNPAAVGPLAQTSTMFAVKGGLSDEEWAVNTFYTWQRTRKAFFTWQLNPRSLHEEQENYLFFMVPHENMAGFTAKYRIYWTDGTQATYEIGSVNDPLQFEFYHIPGGYRELGIVERNPSKTVSYWEVFVQDLDGNYLSEIRKFTLIDEFFPYQQHFAFLNSLGGVDNLVCTGKSVESLQTDQDVLERRYDHTYEVEEGVMEITEKTGTPTLSAFTGYISEEACRRLQDMLISAKVWERLNGRWIPVTIQQARHKIHQDGNTLHYLEIRYTRPKMRRFTPYLDV